MPGRRRVPGPGTAAGLRVVRRGRRPSPAAVERRRHAPRLGVSHAARQRRPGHPDQMGRCSGVRAFPRCGRRRPVLGRRRRDRRARRHRAAAASRPVVPGLGVLRLPDRPGPGEPDRAGAVAGRRFHGRGRTPGGGGGAEPGAPDHRGSRRGRPGRGGLQRQDRRTAAPRRPARRRGDRGIGAAAAPERVRTASSPRGTSRCGPARGT